jgi:hypothetical protein
MGSSCKRTCLHRGSLRPSLRRQTKVTVTRPGAIQGGVSLHELMRLGGWKSYAMVLRYAYAQLAADHLAQAAERVTGKRGHAFKRARASK